LSLLLLLLVPAAAAVLAAAAPDARSAGRGAVAASLAGAAALAAAAWPVVAAGERWFGGHWMLDRFTVTMAGLVVMVWVSAAAASTRYVGAEHDAGILPLRKVRLYYVLMPVFVAAMLVTLLTDHLGVLWIALEVTTLATTPLVALYRKDGAVEAAWKYLLLCSVGISVSLLGLLLLAYAGVRGGLPLGSALSLSALRGAAGSLDPQVVRWAFVLLFVGIGTKVGFVPLHPWLPDAHSRTPSPVSAMLSGVLLNVALYALLRSRTIVDLALGSAAWTSGFFLAFGLASVLFAAFVLLHQQNYKRMLAYHSVEHMGLIAFGLAMGPAGAAGAVMHMVGHTLAKSALFLSAGEILLRVHSTKIPNVGALRGRMPRTSIAFLLGFLGLIGVPTSAIFASELTFLMAAARLAPAAALAIVLALVIVAVGVLHHVFEMIYGRVDAGGDRPGATPGSPVREAWTLTHVVVGAQLALLFAGGVFFLTPGGYAAAERVAAAFTVRP